MRPFTGRILISILVLLTAACGGSNEPSTKQQATEKPTAQKPNLIVMYIDDLGYGDVSSYGATRVQTPHIDQLAARGVKFTDAHSSAATCTPSRYSLLTGEHGFRNEAAILPGDAPLLIRPGKPTIASMLKKAGYTTGVVGKWHLGLGNGSVDWNNAVKPGPLEIGFDYSFLLPATGDRVPTVYLENHHVVNLDAADPIVVSYKEKVGDYPTGYENPELVRVKADRQHSDTIVNGISRIGHMGGGESALWVDEDFPDIFTQKAVEFIRANKAEPFFLFHSFHDIHVPRLPHPRFKNKTDMGDRGDVIVQMDWMIGQITKELETLGIAENTIVVFTSDNGPVLDDGYYDQAVELLGDHNPAGPFRGGKYSAFEAGTRVPTILAWPGTVEPTESAALVSQMDLYASIAKLVGVELADGEAQDSQQQLDSWMGKDSKGRDYLLEESLGTLSLRAGHWKYILPLAKDKELPGWLANKKIEGGIEFFDQLYNLESDIGEQINLAKKHPEKTKELRAKLEDIVSNGY